MLGYAKRLDSLTLNRIVKGDKQISRYTNRDGDPRGPWKASDVLRSEVRDYAIFPVMLPSGNEVWPPSGTSWRYTKEKFAELIADNRIWFGVSGDARPAYKRFLSEVTDSMPATTIWSFDEVGHNDESKKEMRSIFGGDLFGTPKPERLLQRILHIATNPNDLILDSFLGSGTTAAVAHKMGRRWIGIEMGEHAATHCLPRLLKVIDGEQGGISKAVGWGIAAEGGAWNGGGFRFMRLGETVFDDAGRINPAVRFATLAAFIWQQETGTAFDPTTAQPGTPYLGTYYVINSELSIKSVGYMPILSENESKTTLEPLKIPKMGIYLLFNGILGDKRPASGNVLTRDVLAALVNLHASVAPANTPLVVYGESVRVGPARLAAAGVTFKQIPYDVRAR